ncbi:hypothetical protein, partial [Enterobacter roggenkampii]|uniref:hypothetical protein n=1 Tax=Enterobacter roggenkampii TaxID=1812935 RepID=UPI001BE0E665
MLQRLMAFLRRESWEDSKEFDYTKQFWGHALHGLDRFDQKRKLSLYINLCNCLILICSIQHQKQVNLWTKNSCR